MTDEQVRDAVDRLLHALEQMANEAGRKQLDMHPSRHQQAVDRVLELVLPTQAENAALREREAQARARLDALRNAVFDSPEWDYLDERLQQEAFQARVWLAAHPPHVADAPPTEQEASK